MTREEEIARLIAEQEADADGDLSEEWLELSFESSRYEVIGVGCFLTKPVIIE